MLVAAHRPLHVAAHAVGLLGLPGPLLGLPALLEHLHQVLDLPLELPVGEPLDLRGLEVEVVVQVDVDLR